MRSAIVTGASRGLGFNLASQLHEQGWDLVIDARDEAALDEAASRLKGSARVAAIAGDVSDVTHLEEVVGAARSHGPLDLVINNASELGPTPLLPLEDYDANAFQRVLATNVVAPLRLIQLAAPLLGDGATIVNVTSDAGAENYPTWGAYGASKAALEHLSGTLAVERPDLRILWVDPGDLDTEMHHRAAPDDAPSDLIDPADAARALLTLIESDAPSGRYAPSHLYAEVRLP